MRRAPATSAAGGPPRSVGCWILSAPRPSPDLDGPACHAERRDRRPPPGPRPDGPAAPVTRADDRRRPLEGAEETAALPPRSARVVDPETGHAGYGSDLTGCSERARGEVFAGKA